jgi:hypothetical protein
MTPRVSDRRRKRSKSSHRHSKYSSKYLSGTSERRFKDSSNTKERKRDKKYKDKYKEDDFKMPAKFSMTSSEYKRKKESK